MVAQKNNKFEWEILNGNFTVFEKFNFNFTNSTRNIILVLLEKAPGKCIEDFKKNF